MVDDTIFGVQASIDELGAFDQVSVPQSECDSHVASYWEKDAVGAFLRWARGLRHRGAEFDEHSLEQYTSMWKRHWVWLQSRGLTVRQVSISDIERFLMDLRGGRRHDRPVAASTKRRYLLLLHRTYSHLHRIGAVGTNPVAKLPELARHQARQRPARIWLTPEQEQAYIEWCMSQPVQRWDQIRNRALRLVLLGSGITLSEARILKTTDVLDFSQEDRRRIDLIETPQPAGNSSCWDLSTHASHGRAKTVVLRIRAHGQIAAREAPVAGFAVASLLHWLKSRPSGTTGSVLFAAGRPDGTSPWQEQSPTYLNPGDVSLSAKEIHEIVTIATRAIGYEGDRAGPATLRNSFMARQIRGGIPLERIRDWVGLQTTDELLTLQRQVAARLDGVWPE
jgi:site-specific recombinase XerD